MTAELQSADRLQPTLDILQDDLFVLLMQKTINTDTRIERLLVATRSQLLELINDDALPAEYRDRATRFLIALAQQCYLNEYVFDEPEIEQQCVDRLIDRVGQEIKNTKRLPLAEIALICAYRPLNSLPYAASITRHFNTGRDDRIYPLVRLQLINPLIEADLRETLPSFTEIDAGTSSNVRRQYEENPYPRWQYMDYHSPKNTKRWFCDLYPVLSQRDLSWPDEPEILIAGCGTGRQAISAARRFSNSRVTAVDLSRPSLAYGMRQALETGVDNIEFGQADILNIGDLNKRFDIVECVGVLHHMADPLAGFRSVVPMLKSGGFLRLGLYSALGRRNIKVARETVSRLGLGTTQQGIRQFRDHVYQQDRDSDLYQVLNASEFFSTSECRDLVMHVCEHLHDIPEIAAWLDEAGLEFLGFELYDECLADDYRRQNPDDKLALDLDRWHLYEQENPDMFASMYQFWALKK